MRTVLFALLMLLLTHSAAGAYDEPCDYVELKKKYHQALFDSNSAPPATPAELKALNAAAAQAFGDVAACGQYGTTNPRPKQPRQEATALSRTTGETQAPQEK